MNRLTMPLHWPEPANQNRFVDPGDRAARDLAALGAAVEDLHDRLDGLAAETAEVSRRMARTVDLLDRFEAQPPARFLNGVVAEIESALDEDKPPEIRRLYRHLLGRAESARRSLARGE